MLLYEFVIATIGYVLFIAAMLFLIVLSVFTPGWTFLRAKAQGVPVIFTKYKDSFGIFRKGTRPKAECTKIQGAPIHLTKGSHIIEEKSKVPVYTHFANQGINTNWEYSAIIETLQEMGFEINNFDEYKHFINLGTDEDYRENYLKEFEGEELERQTKLVEKLKKLKVEIQENRSYTLNDMKNLHPFNVNSDFVEGITEEEINLALKAKKRHDMIIKFIMVAGIAFAIVVGSLVIFFSVVDIPNKQTVCECIGTGVKNAYMNGTLVV